MKTRVLAFGIAREIFNASSQTMELSEGATVLELKGQLEATYPSLKSLRSYMIAVNDEYAEDDLVLHANDEIAVIPPVSGG
jgi:molybdopterin synthase sulfur carrier subunit